MKELFTASDVARFCQVDLKTIHNWAERGEIRHFRTPGRHMRFRRADVIDFLRKYGYPVPAALVPEKPRVVLLHDDAELLERTQTALDSLFDVQTFTDPLRALIATGAEAPDAVVVGAMVDNVDGVRLVGSLQSSASTRHVRVIYFSDDPRGQEALAAGASAHVAQTDTPKLRDTLEALMGMKR